ncbi:MAG: phosphoenolpyruvate synthase [Candidatus Methylomirabilota bacterium]|nr:phosphoenolpyruvate synthase [candidate division NC10 bacterium]PWB46220.1 MAG: phosphoenolpyruvate synthase [candidate division NC10 bacterium]
MREDAFIRWFDEIDLADIPLVGGKNASLGEMYQHLKPLGVRVPYGFAVTAAAYRGFLGESGCEARIRAHLRDLNTADIVNLRARGEAIRTIILEAPLPSALERGIVAAYERLCGEYGPNIDVAVRSSATAEDLPDASFAGQQESYLNVHGVPGLLEACRKCFASLFTDRAISYREDKGFDHLGVALSVGVQKMVRSDQGASGVMFTIDTETGFRDCILINASYGLGESVVQGSVTPDEVYVFKPTLLTGHRPILQRTVGSKEWKLVYDEGGSKQTRNVPVPAEDRQRFAISDDDILQLARWGCAIEAHYSRKNARYTPMDIEWAKDGRSGELFILQARPETVQSVKRMDLLRVYRLEERGTPVLIGKSVGEMIGQGRARIIADPHHMERFHDGEVLVTDKTDPDWEPVMKKAAAIVTNRGGRTSHAAIVSRELGIPAVVGTEQGTQVIADREEITVSCAEGDAGYVYRGRLRYSVREIDLGMLKRPRTKIMLNVANPQEAFSLAAIPNDGVGLARVELIIGHAIRIHPMALVRYDTLADEAARIEIALLTAAYADKPQYFVDKLAEGVGMIAAAFYPKDVIVRLSDFKTNEYANLIGGKAFEPTEENPMLGFRGASRYYNDRYREGFALECRAMWKVRQEMGLTNVKLMIPFVRTVGEGEKVLAEMATHGLIRGQNGLEVYVMCEIPSNVLLAEEFAEIFDGFSIGSNDLTQLTLGVDRDSELVAPIFDERNRAVKRLIASVIATARARGRKIGICGQAPSDYPEFAQFLVEEEIDSISLNPDAVMKMTAKVLEMEQKGVRSEE